MKWGQYIDRRTWKRLFVLAVSCLGITLAGHIYLDFKLAEYEKEQNRLMGDESGYMMLIPLDSPEQNETDENGEESKLQYYTEALASADIQTESLLAQKLSDSNELKRVYETILELWNSELRNLSSAIIDHMEQEEQQAFLQDQNQFIRERNTEAVKAISDSHQNAAESIEYLRILSDLTRARCFDLLKDYESYLDN